MFVSERSRQFAEETAAANPLQGELQDFGLSYARALDDGRARLQSVSRERGMADAYDRYIDDIYTRTGRRLENPWTGRAVNPAFSLPGPDGGDDFAGRVDAFDAQVRALADKTPDLPVKSYGDLEAEVFAHARDTKAAAERGGVSVGWSGFGTLVGYGQAAMEDPRNIAVTIATLGLGGGEAAAATAAARATLAARLAAAAKPVGITALREGAVNAATEAAIQPTVMGFNQDAGIPYTLGDAAEAVAGAGAAGAVLGGGLHAAGLGLRGLLSRWTEAKAKGHVTPDGDTDAAERVVQALAEGRGDNPFPPGIEGEALYARAMEAATKALRDGQPVDMTRVMAEAESLAELGNIADLEKAKAEVRALAQGMEKTVANPTAGMDAVLVPMREPDMRTVLMRQGPAVERENGSLWVQDVGEERILDQAFGTTGRGLVKILWKHVFPFDRPGAPPRVHVDDILRMPLVLRTKVPHVQGKGSKTTARWVAARQDGEHVLYVARRVTGGEETFDTLSVQVLGENDRKRWPLSSDRKGGSVAGASYAAPDGAKGPAEGPVSGRTPASDNMRPANAVRKSLPPELAPPATKRPETLVGWLKRQGGVQDTDGWLAHMGVDNTKRPGLISGKGLHLDDAALRAWEEGFFPEYPDRPTPDQLRLHMANELGPEGMDRVRGADEGARLEWDAYDQMMADLDRMGVDPWGKSWADVQAAVTIARDSARAEADLWKGALDFIDGDAARTLDEDAARIAKARGDLMATDMPLPTGAEMDGRAVTVSARDTMDAFDAEADAWESAHFCLGR